MTELGTGPEPGELRMRVGSKVGRTLYDGATEANLTGGSIVGLVDTPELAAEIVAAVNAARELPTHPRDREITQALEQVWAAALDAQVMIREEGATEDDYLAKQRFHIEGARALILRRLGYER